MCLWSPKCCRGNSQCFYMGKWKKVKKGVIFISPYTNSIIHISLIGRNGHSLLQHYYFPFSPPFSFNSLYDSYISPSHNLSFVSYFFLSSFLSFFHPKKENRKMGRESRNVCVKDAPAFLGISGAAAKNNLHQNADILSMSFCRKKQSEPKCKWKRCYWEDD